MKILEKNMFLFFFQKKQGLYVGEVQLRMDDHTALCVVQCRVFLARARC